MAEPSEDWPVYKFDPVSERDKRIRSILSSANFDYLEKRGLHARRRHQPALPPDVVCRISLTRFASGFDNLIIKLSFSDGISWIARIPHRIVDDSTKTSLLSEIATMNIIRRHTSIPVPQVYEFELSANQPFGCPFVLMECLKGRSLKTGLAEAIPMRYHAKVAKQFANVFAELQYLTFTRIGRLWCGETAAAQSIEIIPMAWHCSPGPLETSLEYFYNERQGENREVMAMHPSDPDWRTACWVLKTALTEIILEDRVRGPFPLCHLDLHFGNLLFDDDYNLTGVIDWSNAQAAPIEQLSVCPEFSTFPGRSKEENQPIIEFKNLVIHFIKEMEKDKEKTLDQLIKMEKTPLDQLTKMEKTPLDQLTNEMEKDKKTPLDQKQSPDLTSLSTYMASKSAEIAYRHYMASPKSSLWAGKMVAKLVYGNKITWEQLREAYGAKPL